ncbi:hypothetical protein Francci3_4468 [Frankia casuarinae]|uniref:Uncharacterized protein n=1 Tax=Frankia casuarinae (strain DSM 45818 / CECT 9043 / HFP020203 / CcI3) TaxID=106370 RepID=Q2J4H8_FRACC|nr:hypothetical protein Francci3_4468 [Frankia casuarinae]
MAFTTSTDAAPTTFALVAPRFPLVPRDRPSCPALDARIYRGGSPAAPPAAPPGWQVPGHHRRRRDAAATRAPAPGYYTRWVPITDVSPAASHRVGRDKSQAGTPRRWRGRL